MKKLLLSIAFLLPGMGMMAQTQVKTAGGVLEGKTSRASRSSKAFRSLPHQWETSAGRLLSLHRNGRAFAKLRSSDRTRCRNLSSAT